jgi:hypothetical protein
MELRHIHIPYMIYWLLYYKSRIIDLSDNDCAENSVFALLRRTGRDFSLTGGRTLDINEFFEKFFTFIRFYLFLTGFCPNCVHEYVLHSSMYIQ